MAAPTPTPTPTPTFLGMSQGQMSGAAALISAYGQSQAQKAAGIQQQTAFLLQARDSLAIANVRSEMDTLYTSVQAGRTLKKAAIEAQNYTIAGNTLLKNMRATNASIRARMAASGVAVGAGGSFEGVQRENVAGTMRDVGIADLNALTARVMGFEDAAAMFQSTEMQNTLNLFSAKRQAGQYTQAGTAAREQAGLLAGFTLVEGGIKAGQTILKG